MEASGNSLSVLVYGRSPSAEADNVTTHVGIAVHQDTAQPELCSLHHARCPDQIRFIYEHRPRQPYASDCTLRGRCELVNDLAIDAVTACEAIFAKHGPEQKHLPVYGEGNCQTWLADMLQIIESEGMIERGDADFWRGMVRKGRVDVVKAWVEKGRVWVDNPASFEITSEPDARWKDAEKFVGLGHGQIQQRSLALAKLLKGRGDLKEHQSAA